MNLDFSPIVNTKRYQIDKSTLSTTGKKRATQIWLFLLLVIITIIGPLLSLVYWGWPFFVIQPIVIVIWAATLPYLYMHNKRIKSEKNERNISIEDFVAKNGFKYENLEGKRFYINSGSFITKLQSGLYNLDLPYKSEYVAKMYDISGKLNGYQFSYQLSSVIVKQSGSNENSQYPHIIFSIDLPTPLPRIFINSKLNNQPGLDANADKFVSMQEHVLEGDFPNHYSVRIEKNEHIDMLTVLTPEVMQTLIKNDIYDVWINGKQMMLLTFGDTVRYYAGIPVAFETAKVLLNEIDQTERALRQN